MPRADNGDVEHLCYEPLTNRYFNATMAQLYEAAYMLNKKLALDGGVSLEAWCEMLGLEFIPDGKCRGWCIDQMVEDLEYFWLDVECYEQKTDDGLDVYYVTPWADPVEDWEHYEENCARENSSVLYGGENNEQEKEHLEDSGYGRNDIWLSRHDDAGICRRQRPGCQDRRGC